MSLIKNNSPIVGRACKHATYGPHLYDRTKDLTSVKITNIHEDGSRSNELMLIENYKQPIWIVKEKFRKFKQHKDYIKESVTKKHALPRCQIGSFVSRELYGRNNTKATTRDARMSPYVFGVDQTPPVHIKEAFFRKYPDHQPKEIYNVGAYDVETDMVNGSEEILMASITHKNKAYFSGLRRWFPDKDDETIIRKLKEAADKYASHIFKERNIEIVFELADNPGEVVKNNVQRFHEWDIDYVASWNASFDMERSIKALEENGYETKDIFNDPSVPKEYRVFDYNPGRTHKVKDNGDSQPLESQEKFPTVYCHSKWQWVDAMSVYAIKRFAAGKLDSYSLQFCAEREELSGKLYTDDSGDLLPGTPQWHRHLQKNFPYLYCIYNIVDNIVIEDINAKTKDISLTLPMLLRFSETANFVSQPRLISDTLSFIARDMGFVWGSAPAIRDKSISDKLPTLGNWIAILHSEKLADKGVRILDGLADVISRGRTSMNDIDVTGAYPHATLSNNVSNRTTQMEVCRIEGLSPLELREVGVNIASSVQANALSLGPLIFGLPKVSELVGIVDELVKERPDLEEDLKRAA